MIHTSYPCLPLYEKSHTLPEVHFVYEGTQNTK
jgi:hypothetical protein